MKTTYADTTTAAHAIEAHFRQRGRREASAFTSRRVLVDHDGAEWEMVDNPRSNWPVFYRNGLLSSARDAYETFLQI